MRKFCFLLVLLLLLTGCSRQSESTEPTQSADTSTTQWEEPQLVTFDIYAINDLHGKLADSAAQPGVDELTTYLKKAQREGNTILLSTGDMWQGSSESNLTGGQIVTEWMNELGFAAMTIGGHEFDWGEDSIRQNKDLAEFPFLAINIYDRKTDRQADYCQSSVVVEIDGAKIGIIGAIGDCTNSVASQNIQNVYFKTGPELTELVMAEAEMLRSQDVDFIIYAIHDGYDQNSSGTTAMEVMPQALASYYDPILSEGHVDLVFEADTHFTYVLRDSRGVYHLQAGGNNTGLSHASVLIDKANGEHFVFAADLVSASQYSFLEDDPAVARLMEKYAEQIAPATQVLGYNSQYRTGNHICQLVADLYCAAGIEKWGEQYDIVLAGGYISCRSPGYLPEGEVTYSQLQSLQPFDNPITLCTIRGRDLLSKFLETDHQAYFIKTTPYGERIRGSIDPDALYYVVTDSYTSDYAPNHMTVIDTYDPGVFARDLLAEYVSAGRMD